MGVQLGDLVTGKKISLGNLASRSLAFDGNNILYQFLSIIRGREGEYLRDNEGRVTSHLSGLIYRNSNLIELGIKIAYVFDGKPHMFKEKIIRKRKESKLEARSKYKSALEEGRIEEAKIYAQQTVSMKPDMIADAKQLLSLMGMPWIQAPGEGEAQSAHMAKEGAVWGAASQDFDSLLFGAPNLVRNLSITGRRKLPRKNVYVKIEPEVVKLPILLKELNLSRKQLIDIGLLIGTDYNPKGVKGIGPKTALKLILKHGSLDEAISHIENADFPHPYEDIRKLFLNPMVTNEYNLDWNTPDQKGIVEFLCEERDFDKNRVIKAVEKIEKGFKKAKETTTLEKWF
jgi:flap endonuclease-1